jgi:hypothetical protein
VDKRAVLAHEDARTCLIEAGVPADAHEVGYDKGRAYARGAQLPKAAAACLIRSAERYQMPITYSGRRLVDLRMAYEAFANL